MSFTFCFCVVAVLPSISVMYEYGLRTGGPAVLIWGWILTSVMSILIGCR
jgi:hypothetical protein